MKAEPEFMQCCKGIVGDCSTSSTLTVPYESSSYSTFHSDCCMSSMLFDLAIVNCDCALASQLVWTEVRDRLGQDVVQSQEARV